MINKSIFFILLFSSFLGLHINAQEKSNIKFDLGYGNYEGGYLTASCQYY